METENKYIGIFFVNSINPDIGGVETHQNAFVDFFFSGNHNFRYIVAKNGKGAIIFDCNKSLNKLSIISTTTDQDKVAEWLNKAIDSKNIVFFLNDPWWIEFVPTIRKMFPMSLIMMRSGGNDVEKAPFNIGCYSYQERREKYRGYINTMDYIVANSDFSVNRLLTLGIKGEKIVKIRGGVNTNTINTIIQANNLEKIKKSLLSNKKYIVLYACRFVKFKGILESLLALSLSEIKNEVKLLLIGDGPLKDNIEEFCRVNFESDQYQMIGKVDNTRVLKYMMVSDIVVNSSIELKQQSGDGWYIHTETMGRTMMEAISVGTHILATNVGGTYELFFENDNIGLIVNPDITSLINAFNSIPKLILKPLKQLTDYSWNFVFSEYNKIFNSYAFKS